MKLSLFISGALVICLSGQVTLGQSTNWLGTSSTNWNSASNWSSGSIPDETVNVTIPAGTPMLPDFSAAAFPVKNLTVAVGVHLSINSGAEIDVHGDFTNNGIIDGDGLINLNGAVAQHIYGKGTIANLGLANASGAVVNPTDLVNITGDLTLSSGTLTTNGGIVLVSNDLVAGRIAPITGGAINGTVTVQQYFPGGRRAYRFFGHPFNAAIALTQLENPINAAGEGGMDITGAGGAANGFTTTVTNASSCFWYNTGNGNSISGYDPGWTPFTATDMSAVDNQFNQYEGIRLFVRGAKGEGLTHGEYIPSAVTVNMTGYVNTGDFDIPLSKGTNSDYNMVSNPYPSPTDIGAVVYRAKLDGKISGSAFFVWNPYLGVNGQYQATPIMDHFYIIGENTSFQVRANYDGAPLSFMESDKATTPNTDLLRTSENSPFISFSISDSANHPWDMTYISFNDKASNNEETDNDAQKLTNPDLNFYSLSAENHKLSIDARPFNSETVIALGITTSYKQKYTIKAQNVILPGGGRLFLHDKFTQSYTAMTDGAQYTFSITDDAATQGENRFELTTTQASEIQKIATQLSVSMSPNPATNNVTISFSAATSAATSIHLINAAGEILMSKNEGLQQSGKISLDLSKYAPGIYLIETTSGTEKTTQRLIIE